jgi:hypothetical protein
MADGLIKLTLSEQLDLAHETLCAHLATLVKRTVLTAFPGTTLIDFAITHHHRQPLTITHLRGKTHYDAGDRRPKGLRAFEDQLFQVAFWGLPQELRKYITGEFSLYLGMSNVAPDYRRREPP